MSTDDLVAWLQEQRGVSAPIHKVSAPDFPPRVVTVRPTGGLRDTTEGAFERPTYQLRSRGSTESEAKELADTLDSAVRDVERPFYPGGTLVIDVGRSGGPPAVATQTDAGWVEYACTYYFEADSGR